MAPARSSRVSGKVIIAPQSQDASKYDALIDRS
jgi:hypothetical protein